MQNDPRKILTAGIQALNLVIQDEVISKLLTYIELILKWNKLYNLTAATSLYELIIKHILDSLAITPYVTLLPEKNKNKSEADKLELCKNALRRPEARHQSPLSVNENCDGSSPEDDHLKGGERILDVGSGAGFPGLPLALALPKAQFFLLDSQRKRITFLNHAILMVQGKNMQTVYSRIEDFQSEIFFDTIVTRATYSIDDMIAKTERLLKPNGQILMLQGKRPAESIPAENANYTLSYHPLQVPFLDAERHLIRIKNK